MLLTKINETMYKHLYEGVADITDLLPNSPNPGIAHLTSGSKIYHR